MPRSMLYVLYLGPKFLPYISNISSSAPCAPAARAWTRGPASSRRAHAPCSARSTTSRSRPAAPAAGTPAQTSPTVTTLSSVRPTTGTGNVRTCAAAQSKASEWVGPGMWSCTNTGAYHKLRTPAHRALKETGQNYRHSAPVSHLPVEGANICRRPSCGNVPSSMRHRGSMQPTFSKQEHVMQAQNHAPPGTAAGCSAARAARRPRAQRAPPRWAPVLAAPGPPGRTAPRPLGSTPLRGRMHDSLT